MNERVVMRWGTFILSCVLFIFGDLWFFRDGRLGRVAHA